MFKVIVWATDGSSRAEQALPFAKELAKAAALGKQVADSKQEGLNAKLQMGEVMAGGAAHVIAEIADKEGADLIVAGTRRHGPPLRVAAWQCHAAPAARRALPGAGRPFSEYDDRRY